MLLQLAVVVMAAAAAQPEMSRYPAMKNHRIQVGDEYRNYFVHLPPSYQHGRPMPVVMVLHGAGINARIMSYFCGMNKKADEAGFIAVYPNGSGVANTVLAFNSGNLPPEVARHLGNDVAYFRALLDDLEKHYSVDTRRIYSCGISNGGMMSYRLAVEMADRIAAIAAVGGTLTLDREDCRPVRPVPVLHMHGLSDWIVPYEGVSERARRILPFVTFKSVEETIAIWIEINQCRRDPMIELLDDRYDDGTVVSRWTFHPLRGDAEVVLYRIAGGGHTWPGFKAPLPFLGRSTQEINANDVIWDFFRRHPMPQAR